MTISRFIPRMNRKKRKVSSPSSEIKSFTGAYMDNIEIVALPKEKWKGAIVPLTVRSND